MSLLREAEDADGINPPSLNHYTRRGLGATEWSWIPDQILSEPADDSVVPTFEFLRRIVELGPHSTLRERWPPVPSFLSGRRIPKLNERQRIVDAIVGRGVWLYPNESPLKRWKNGLVPQPISVPSIPGIVTI